MSTTDIDLYIEDLLVGDKIIYKVNHEQPGWLVSLGVKWLFICIEPLEGPEGFFDLDFCSKDGANLNLDGIGYEFQKATNSIINLHRLLSKLHENMTVSYRLAYQLGLIPILADRRFETVPSITIVEHGDDRSAMSVG